MKKTLLLLAALVLMTSLMSGCGVINSYDERVHRYQQINDLQARMLVDDWDYFWLYERNTYLCEWYPRVGW